jgi:phage baseplate assembly protein W
MASDRQDRHLLTDIALELLDHQLRPVYRVATVQKRVKGDNGVRRLTDMVTVSGRDNLALAFMLRLLTARGELRQLAHPDYGSRLHELIGRPNTENTRNLVKLYILEALQQEPRVARVMKLEISPVPASRDQVRVDLQVQPAAAGEPVVIDGLVINL